LTFSSDGLGITGAVPCESTFRRVLQSLDADALDGAAGAWAQQRTAPARGGRRLVAVDGKTLRGSAVAGQPGLHARLAALPWRQIPAADIRHDRGHGRAERRSLKVTAVAAGIAFPHAAQAIQVVRRRRPLNGKNSKKWSSETIYAVTSLTAARASPAQLAGIFRGHWSIEDSLH
jgi:hypothetical protein